MRKKRPDRYFSRGSFARLATVACGSLTGRRIDQIVSAGDKVGIQMEMATFARIRRGEVENPGVWTSTCINALAHRLGAAPTSEFHVELVSQAQDLEAEHTQLRRKLKAPHRDRQMAYVRFQLYAKAIQSRSRPRRFRDQDEEFGCVWSSTNDILRAASVSYDAKDEKGLKQALPTMSIARAYVFGGASFSRLAKAIRSWPGFTAESPSVVLQPQRGHGKVDPTLTLVRKRWLQYAVAVQNAAVAYMNLHALGVLEKDDRRVARATASMQRLFKDFDLHSTFAFLNLVCAGTDLQRKYLRNFALCCAVAGHRTRFDKAVATFNDRFGFDPVANPTKVKGEEEYPSLKSDVSVHFLLQNKGVVDV
jgi:hypothetical protein